MDVLKNKIKEFKNLKRAELETFQGDLKDIRQEDIQILMDRIKERGFISPLFIWENKILDGHQRLKALDRLSEEGHELKDDLIPCIFIDAEDEKEAASFVLYYSDQRAEITESGFQAFVEKYDLVIDDYEHTRFYEETLSFHSEEDSIGKNKEVNFDSLEKDLNVMCPKCNFQFKQ